MKSKILNLIGMAQKAGKVVSGEYGVTNAVRTGKARMVIVASDASENTKKRFHDMTVYYSVDLYFILSKSELGSCIGRIDRAVIAITDVGFYHSLQQLLAQFEGARKLEVD